MKREINFWLVTTEHLENQLWFRDEDDFKVGMNYVAVQAAVGNVSVLAFILMSNHVHFVLKGNRIDAMAFIVGFKSRYAKYFQHKYSEKEILRRNGVDLKPLPIDEEAIERAIAYVHMNCVAANICSSPMQYEWGSGNILFNRTRREGIKLKDISLRKRRQILHCAIQLPLDWILGKNEYILPDSYLDIEGAEFYFRTPKRMNYFLASSSKARKRLESDEDSLPAFRDQVVSAALQDICRTLFGCNSLAGLSAEQVTEVLRQIRFRFSSDIRQIARVAGLSYSETAVYLDQV